MRRPWQRYPVFYLHDGQNLFDQETAFAGQEWRADETAEELIREGAIHPVIMVGIYNAGVIASTNTRPRRMLTAIPAAKRTSTRP